MSRPRVVVGIPTYQSEPFLQQTLRSVLEQDVDGLEVVLRDDRSSDRTLELCRDLIAGDGRARLIEGSRRLGWIGNCNALIEYARGDYFAFLPHDDLYEPGFLRAMTARLDARPDAVLAYSGAQRIDVTGRALGPWPGTAHMAIDRGRLARALRYLRWTEYEKGWLFHGLMRSSALRRTGGLRPLRFAADNVLVFHLALLGSFSYDPQLRCRKRMVDGSVSARYGHTTAEWGAYLAEHHAVIEAAELPAGEARVLHAAALLRQARFWSLRPVRAPGRAWRVRRYRRAREAVHPGG